MDSLSVFDGLSACYSCGALQQKGSSRCPECGTFHSTGHLEDRPDPPRGSNFEPVPVADPSLYSMNPDAEIKVEDQVDVKDMTRTWSDGGTDFHLGDDEEDVTRRVDLKSLRVPSPEYLLEEE